MTQVTVHPIFKESNRTHDIYHCLYQFDKGKAVIIDDVLGIPHGRRGWDIDEIALDYLRILLDPEYDYLAFEDGDEDNGHLWLARIVRGLVEDPQVLVWDIESLLEY